ncbi:MAG: lipoprotein insertase outer membrane protein LolB [Porticoccaceae bacterium]|nr:lipoprotein insertase outer membrane protein LolB [Porticoccaceae bacterium]
MTKTLSKLAVMLLVVSGCSSQPTITSSGVSWQQHSARITSLNQWQVDGKLGYKSAGQGGSANLNWSQNQQQYQLSLSGPFGAGSAIIRGNNRIASLYRGNQADTDLPQQLALRLTGLPIPVDALSWWARGLPSPSKDAATDLITGADGAAMGFNQAGWQLAFSRYSFTSDGNLPGKIVGQLGDHSFKLVISRWSFPEK